MKRFLRVVVVLASIGGAVWLFLKRSGGDGGGEAAYEAAPVAAPVSAPAAPPAKPAASTDGVGRKEAPAQKEAAAKPEPAAAKEAAAKPEPAPPVEGKSPAEVKALAAKEPYGPGSATAGPGGEPPEGYTIKGNAGSKLYHTADSPYYKRTKAEIWFATEEAAATAGFERWDAKRKK